MTAPFGATSRQTYHRRRMGLIGLLAASTAVWVVARWRPFRVEVSGGSMEPTLLPGDWVLATVARRVDRGDVVVIGHPLNLGMEMVKRLTGVPGDRVLPDRALDPDEWFVSGDNADASTDSRTFGPVSRADIVGRARLVYWPPGRIGVIRGR